MSNIVPDPSSLATVKDQKPWTALSHLDNMSMTESCPSPQSLTEMIDESTDSENSPDEDDMCSDEDSFDSNDYSDEATDNFDSEHDNFVLPDGMADLLQHYDKQLESGTTQAHEHEQQIASVTSGDDDSSSVSATFSRNTNDQSGDELMSRRSSRISTSSDRYTSSDEGFTSSDEDWSSDDEEDYEDLMAEMPIALGRKEPPSAPQPRRAAPSSSQLENQHPVSIPECPPLPVLPLAGSAIPASTPIDITANPMEGLAMLQSIRSELEQVGRMIVAQRDGEKFLQRAHILASINWLSSNVPSCVLDHLGQEIRDSLKAKAERNNSEVDLENHRDSIFGKSVAIMEDDSSHASDLSDAHMSDFDDQYDRDLDYLMDDAASQADSYASHEFCNGATPTPRRLSSAGFVSIKSPATRAHSESKRRSSGAGFGLAKSPIRRTSSSNLSNISGPLIIKSPVRRRSSAISLEDGSPRKQFLLRNKSTISWSTATVSSTNLSTTGQSANMGTAVSGDSMYGLRTLPSVSYFQCALLFVDISGFTQLSTRVGPEHLSKVINSYFQKIVDKIFEFGGDIQKFAGDALFAEWRVSSLMSLSQCVEASTACASSLVRDCADFPVMALGGIVEAAEGYNSPLTRLNVHCGLGVGEMAGIHIGDSIDRREYVYLGDPICQATNACQVALLGQVVASDSVYDLLVWSGIIEDDHAINERQNFHVLAEREATRFNEARLEFSYRSRVRNAKSRGITDHVDGLQVEALMEYRRLMSLYVHPVVVSNDVAASDNFRSSRTNKITNERHSEEAELRSVYVMFINPQVTAKLTGNASHDKWAARLMNNIMCLTTRELKRYNGHLRQFIMDDKGLVLIATFGLRGSTFPNLVTERALPATIVLHNTLLTELGVDSRIGATFGDVYCGPVGGAKRNEYAVMGPSVNLAARLMASPKNPGILVDNAVRKLASRSYSFNALDPVIAKGYEEPVPIFEPLAAVERSWGRIEPTFVGREEEILKIMEISREMIVTEDAQPKLVMISSTTGMGKTSFLAHAIEHVKAAMRKRSRHLVITKAVANEGDSLLPFKTIRPILIQLLCDSEGLDDSSCHTQMSALNRSLHLDALSCGSSSSTSLASVLHARTRFDIVASMLESSSKLVNVVKRCIIVDDPAEMSLLTKIRPSALVELANLLSHIVRKCIKGCRLILMAIDDIHHADASSWHVLRNLFESADNLLILGTNYATTDYSLRIDNDFCQALNTSYSKAGRFVNIELGRLDEQQLELMTMKALGLQRQELDSEVRNEVIVQSGGVPHFAKKVLDGIRDRIDSSIVDTLNDRDDSIADIILHRFDTLDISVRYTLNVGAVIGDVFTFGAVLAVMKESSDAKEDDLRRQTGESLKVAVTEGILLLNDDDSCATLTPNISFENDSSTFKFRNAAWRPTLLRLMLESRKKDVHRKIAQSMEKSMDAGTTSIDLKLSLCLHWKCSGDTSKATSSALKTGKFMEQELSAEFNSVELYQETLKMWGWSTENSDDKVAGFSSILLGYMGTDDLSNILSLMVALGRSLYMRDRHQESVRAFEDTLRILQSAKLAPELKDRSVVFPAFVGLSHAIADGHIQQDAYCRYEQTMIKRFIQETRIHGRLIHHIYALYLQQIFYGRQGELEKAIAVQSLIKQLYKPEKHSKGLRNVYGKDAAALSFCFASFFRLAHGDNKQALKVCRYVFKDLFPRIESSDFKQSFEMIYPLVHVLRETGHPVEARGFFDKVVVQPFEEEMCKTSPFAVIYRPLMMLLDLSSREHISADTLDDCELWASLLTNLQFDPSVNIALGHLGRCADSISAEICLLIASRLPDGSSRRTLIANGLRVALHAAIFCRRNKLTLAVKHANAICAKLRCLNRESTMLDV